MKNAYTIGGLGCQLQKVSERIYALTRSIEESEESNTDLTELYEDQLLDEVGHAQVLVLKMAELAVEATSEGEANADEGDSSVFTEGDLAVEKTDEDTGTGDTTTRESRE